MSSIAIEHRTVDVPLNSQTFNFQHLYLVYTDDAGNEFTIGGHKDTSGSGLLKITNGLELQSVPRPGEGGDFRENTDEARIERHHTVLNFGDRDPNVIWLQMMEQAAALSEAKIPYDTAIFSGESDNSNTTVASVLNAVGIDVNKVLPSGLNSDNVPGSEDIFSEYADLLNTNIFGSSNNDVIYGGYGDDIISGSGGNDILSGFTPFFQIKTDDANKDEVDVLTGGIGEDLFILGSENGRFYQNTPTSGDNDVEINPYKEGSSTFLNLDNITPQDFALITDFNPEEGDKLLLKGPGSFSTNEGDFNTYRVIGIKNSVFTNIEGLASQINILSLDPNAYSSAIVYSQGFNKTETDIREDDIVAILPGNSENPLYGGGIVGSFDLTPGSGDVVFV